MDQLGVRPENYTKITIEIKHSDGQIQRISIEENSSEHDLHDFLYRLVRPMLHSVGYSESIINEYLNEE